MYKDFTDPRGEGAEPPKPPCVYLCSVVNFYSKLLKNFDKKREKISVQMKIHCLPCATLYTLYIIIFVSYIPRY